MSRTRRRDAHDNFSVPKQLKFDPDRDDEDTDPRTYNVIQRDYQERNPLKVAEAMDWECKAMGLPMRDD